MASKFKYLVLFLAYAILQGCATEPLQAPCNNSANQCAPTVKINQWTAE